MAVRGMNLPKGKRVMEQKTFTSRIELTQALANEVTNLLRSDLVSKGSAALAVSGGRTPIDLFEQLSKVELDWSKVFITLVDERWVEPNHEASNEALVRRHFLQNYASEANFVALKTHYDSAYDAVTELHQRLMKLPLPMTVSILGMGEDGHTASFFPGAKTLSKALDMDSGLMCCATTPLTAPHDRMTLTLPTVLASKKIILHLTGDSKLPVLEAALAEGDVEEMPVRSVLKQTQTPVTIYFAS
ncbi:MAG: 6-phosphogluconolactonase [Reinekea sp.]|jgi:6-phosphogluconolactonase